MRAILLLSALLLSAGSAAASAPSQSVQPEQLRSTSSFRISGSVLLLERPLPGAVLHYPGMFTPLRGQHGGLLAERAPAAGTRLDRG